jgi:hypothetical protein
MAAPGKKLAPAKPPAPTGAHARRYPRFALDARMQVRMFQDGEFRNCWGRSTELGQDGIGATLTGELETGEIVSLEIPLPLSPYPLESPRHRSLPPGPPLRLRIPHPQRGSQRDMIRRVCEMLANKT